MPTTGWLTPPPSSLAVHFLHKLGHKVPPPRSYSPAGILGFALDGNIIGGALLGAGMSLASSCPGMVFPQLAMGVPSAQTTLAGAVVGGVFWSAVLRPWVAARLRRRAAKGKRASSPPRTLGQLLGQPPGAALVIFQAVLWGVVVTVAGNASTAPSALQPITGGLVIGGAQLVSLLLRGSLVGVSTCYENAGDWVLYLLGGGTGPQPAVSSLVFSASMMAGSLLLARARPGLVLLPLTEALTVYIAPWKAFWGGFLMAVGSRLGGGCASGHGISGMGLMSVSSFVSMSATFAAAIAVSKLWP